MTEPLVIAPGKLAYAATLEDACRELGIADESPRERFRALAVHCKMNANTLVANLPQDGAPGWETIKRLRNGTGIPVATWLLRLEILEPDDIAHALAYDQPPELLSEPQQRALDLVEGLPEEAALAYLDFWARTPGLAQQREGRPRSVRRKNRRPNQAR